MGEVSIGSARGQRSGKRLSLRHCHTILPSGPSLGYACPSLSVIPTSVYAARVFAHSPHSARTHTSARARALSVFFFVSSVRLLSLSPLLPISLDSSFASPNARSFHLCAALRASRFPALSLSLYLSIALPLFPSLDFIPYERGRLLTRSKGSIVSVSLDSRCLLRLTAFSRTTLDAQIRRNSESPPRIRSFLRDTRSAAYLGNNGIN